MQDRLAICHSTKKARYKCNKSSLMCYAYSALCKS